MKLVLSVIVSLAFIATSLGLPQSQGGMPFAEGKIQYTIAKTFNGTDVDAEDQVKLTLSGTKDKGLTIQIEAPFYNDTAPAGPAGRFDELWNHEVVEVFILAPYTEEEKATYLELEFGPHNHYLVYGLEGVRNPTDKERTLKEYEAKIDEEKQTWTGLYQIPISFLPTVEDGKYLFNAYAIHGNETERTYLALYPASEDTLVPDFHNLTYFEPIDLSQIIADADGNGALSFAVNHALHFAVLALLAIMLT